MDALHKSILATFCYYDVVDYPLTATELQSYQLRPPLQEWERPEFTPVEIDQRLEKLVSDGLLCTRDGLYALRGREELFDERLWRQRFFQSKRKKLVRIVKLLRFFPFVRMILLTGRMAMKNTEEQSDLDILVVLKSGHIWTGRAVMTAMLAASGLRKHGATHKDHVCLNCFLSDSSLGIIHKDYYAANEYALAFPLFDADNVYSRFLQQNLWIQEFKPAFSPHRITPPRAIPDKKIARATRRVFETLLGLSALERWLRGRQKQKIDHNPLTQEPGAVIVATDNALIFWPKPKAPKIEQAFFKKYQEIVGE
jgi:hypothetical protein